MTVNALARLTLIGLVYIYSTKLIDTAYHGIFKHIGVATIIVGLNILSGLSRFTIATLFLSSRIFKHSVLSIILTDYQFKV